MNKEQLEKHAVVDFSIRLTLQTDEKEKKTHCVTRTLGNCPSISFGKSLRHVSSRVCNSLKFFEPPVYPLVIHMRWVIDILERIPTDLTEGRYLQGNSTGSGWLRTLTFIHF